jgi:hypothetical protein
MLTGCVLNNIFAVISNTLFHIDGTVVTAANTEDGKTVYITHGENFNKDDIDFVLMLHGKTRNDWVEYEVPPNYRLVDALNFALNGSSLFLVHFENPYIICAYLKPDTMTYIPDKWGDYEFDVTKYVWYKFDNSTQMAEEINGMKLTEDAYLIYDCTIKRDIANSFEYNKNCMYYIQIESEYTYQKIISNMILYYDYPHLITQASKFVPHVEYGAGQFEVYIDENNKEYLVFHEQTILEDGTILNEQSKNELGEYYNTFSPCFVVFEELDEYYEYNGAAYIRRYAGIELNMLFR